MAATCRFVVPWMRVSAQRSSQRSRYACASSRLSKRTPLSGVFLAMPTPDSTFPLRSCIPDPARQSHHAIVGEHIAKQWINRGIVNVRNQDAFFQVVENDDSRTATESAKGSPSWQSHEMRALERHASKRTDLRLYPRVNTNSRAAAVLARLRVADQRTAAVIDLGFSPWLGQDDPRCLGQLATTQPAYETLYRLVVAWITVVRNEILPDGLGIPSTAPCAF